MNINEVFIKNFLQLTEMVGCRPAVGVECIHVKVFCVMTLFIVVAGYQC
jgi:hypothetical protein